MSYDEFSDRPDAGNPGEGQPRHDLEQSEPNSLEELLAEYLAESDAEVRMLQRMLETPHPATPDGAAGAEPDLSVAQTTGEVGPREVTVLHQARGLTAGDLRAALQGVPDDRPVAIDVPVHPGAREMYRHVLVSTDSPSLLLADENVVLDPSLVLRSDFPEGLYDLTADEAAGGDTPGHPR